MFAQMFGLHENARPHTTAFVKKCDSVLADFTTVHVPGNGYCLFTSINILTGIDFRPRMTEFIERYQPSLTGVIDLQVELENPNNLSEVWASFIADALHCRFIVLTYDGSKTGVVEIVGQLNETYDTTFYLLLNTGHYYPLISECEVNLSEWLK